MENVTPEVKNYIDILEKTNQQLSLWQNPYGLMVGTLAVLFTILTIVAVIIIYRQGQEYKNRIEADRDLYKRKIEDFLDAQMKVIKNRDIENIKLSKKADEIIKAYQNQLNKSSKEQKAEIQKVIDKLEVEKISIKNSGPVIVEPNQIDMATVLGWRKYCKCSNCGFGFYVDTSKNAFATIDTSVTCPKCGSVNI